MSKHGICDLEEAGNVGACLQVRVVLLSGLHAPARHTTQHKSCQKQPVASAGRDGKFNLLKTWCCTSAAIMMPITSWSHIYVSRGPGTTGDRHIMQMAAEYTDKPSQDSGLLSQSTHRIMECLRASLDQPSPVHQVLAKSAPTWRRQRWPS